LLAALVVGGCVHIVPEEVAHDPRRLLELLEREQLSILETVPSLLRIMLEELEAASEAGEKPELAKLRWLMPTGEALATELCRRWLALYPRVPLVNAYGPTECSDDVTHQLIRQVGEREGASMPIGRPLGNLRLYVLDEQREPVHIGVRGEVYVGEVGVGRGYVGEQ
jgi:non-ribosomal peptide synthetase component F